jgi:hypothetical protein
MTVPAAAPTALARMGPFTPDQLVTAFSVAAVGAAAALSLAASLQPFVDPRLLFMDTAAAAARADHCCRFYFAFVSHLGVIGWALTAGVCLFAALCVLATTPRRGLVLTLAYAGGLGLLFVLDDLLMLHERVFPRLGVPQAVVLGTFAALGAGYGLLQRRLLLSREGAFLTLAFLLFGLSLACDLLHEGEGPIRLAEDSFKFVGIASWGVFHLGLALRAVTGTRPGRLPMERGTDSWA